MSLFSSASTTSPGAVGLPRFRLRAAPIGLSSINTTSYYKHMFAHVCSHDCGETSLSVLSFLRLVSTGVNRDSRRTPTNPQGLVPTGPAQAPQGLAVAGVFPGRSCRVGCLRGFI